MRDIMAVIRTWLQSECYVVNESVNYRQDGWPSRQMLGRPHFYHVSSKRLL
jgi:hypothetical protein